MSWCQQSCTEIWRNSSLNNYFLTGFDIENLWWNYSSLTLWGRFLFRSNVNFTYKSRYFFIWRGNNLSKTDLYNFIGTNTNSCCSKFKYLLWLINCFFLVKREPNFLPKGINRGLYIRADGIKISHLANSHSPLPKKIGFYWQKLWFSTQIS